ncbi:amidase signature domain-containing protein [Hyaloraphidium curvatum]|nr:amidase signature domain-containing protein [Hyaloraphidium curvatum]
MPDPTLLSAGEIQSLVASGQLTYSDVAGSFLARIRDCNGLVNAVMEVNPRALEDAKKADEAARKDPSLCKAIFGIPVLVKDNVICFGLEDEGERNAGPAGDMPTTATAGSLALVGARWKRRADIARRLADAGAVLIASANMSEWANFRSSAQLDGWSARGGKTHNPYDMGKGAFGPTGSSSGSGAGLASRFATLAVGSETDGSIIMPSSRCAVVGIKPTVGLVSRAGIIPISPTQDTAGPMAHDVAGAAALLDVLAGPEPRDPATLHCGRALPAGGFAAAAALGRERGFAGLRIGLDKGMLERCPRNEREAAELAVREMRAAGAEIVDVELLVHDEMEKLGKIEELKLTVEFREALDGFLSSNLDPSSPASVPRTMASVIAFNETTPAEMTYDQKKLVLSQAFSSAASPSGRRTWDDARALAARLDEVAARERLDCFFTSPWGGCTTICGVLGYPVVTVPYGFSSKTGCPFGVCFFGVAWTDAVLVRAAAALEQHVVRRLGKQICREPVDFAKWTKPAAGSKL